MRTYTGYLGNIRITPQVDGGLVKKTQLTDREVLGATGWSLFAKNISLQTASRGIREIAHGDIGVMDSDAGSAYFDGEFRPFDKLRVEIPRPHTHFQLDKVSKYTGDR